MISSSSLLGFRFKHIRRSPIASDNSRYQTLFASSRIECDMAIYQHLLCVLGFDESVALARKLLKFRAVEYSDTPATDFKYSLRG
jgi:hypothetical protein